MNKIIDAKKEKKLETKFENKISSMNIYEKINYIQSKLVDKKTQTNSMMKSKHRSIEDTLANLKPLLIEYGINIMFEDELICSGEFEFKKDITKFVQDKQNNNKQNETSTRTEYKGNKYYIKAILTLVNIHNPQEIIIKSALSVEAVDKVGVQPEMLTGMASTYARKKCLAGVFLSAENDALDPDNIINEALKLEEKQEVQDELINSFNNQIDDLENLNQNERQNLIKRMNASSLPSNEKNSLINKYILKGQKINEKFKNNQHQDLLDKLDN